MPPSQVKFDDHYEDVDLDDMLGQNTPLSILGKNLLKRKPAQTLMPYRMKLQMEQYNQGTSTSQAPTGTPASGDFN